MSDLRHVTAGESLEIPANGWNELVDLARASRLRNRQPDPLRSRLGSKPSVLMVRNDTGALLPAFSVLKIGDPYITPSANLDEFRYGPTNAKGTTPTSATDRICITLTAIPGEDYDKRKSVGPAVAIGYAPVKIKDGSTGSFAKPMANDSTQLEATPCYTAIRIHFKENVSGVTWAYVALGDLNLLSLPDYDAAKDQALTHAANGCVRWADMEEC